PLVDARERDVGMRVDDAGHQVHPRCIYRRDAARSPQVDPNLRDLTIPHEHVSILDGAVRDREHRGIRDEEVLAAGGNGHGNRDDQEQYSNPSHGSHHRRSAVSSGFFFCSSLSISNFRPSMNTLRTGASGSKYEPLVTTRLPILPASMVPVTSSMSSRRAASMVRAASAASSGNPAVIISRRFLRTSFTST